MKVTQPLLCIFFLLFILLGFSACDCDDEDSSAEALAEADDDDSSGDDDDDDDDNDDDNDDNDNDNDDDNDDDDNDDDNDDDTVIDADGPLLFTGPVIGEQWSVTPAAFLKTDDGWRQYQAASLPKGIHTKFYFMPYCTVSGRKIFAGIDYFEVAGMSLSFYYKILSMDVVNGWQMDMLRIGQVINNISAIAEDTFYLISNYSLLLLRKNGINNVVALPQAATLLGMHFIGEGEGRVGGVDDSTEEAVYFRFHQGAVTAHAMPAGYESDIPTSFHLFDVDNGWVFGLDQETFQADLQLGGTQLWRLSAGVMTPEPAPSGCTVSRLWQMDFADENFGIVTTNTNKYYLLDQGAWTCQTLPVAADVYYSFVHIVSPDHYYIGVNNTYWYWTHVFEFVDGVPTAMTLPQEYPLYYGITTMGDSAPAFSKMDPVTLPHMLDIMEYD